MAAAGAPLIYLLLLLCQLPPGGSNSAQDRRFSETKRCADPECSQLMCRGKALEDFTGPDCRFVNFKKDELIYVYHKLQGRSSDLWAGSVGTYFGYFPKDLIDIKKDYVSDELELPTDETDFVCFDTGEDNFNSYNVDELLNKEKGSTTGKGTQPGEPPSEPETTAEESLASKVTVSKEEPSPVSEFISPTEELPQSESVTTPEESSSSGTTLGEQPASESAEPPSSKAGKPPEEPPFIDSEKPIDEGTPSSESEKLPEEPLSTGSGKVAEEPPTESEKLPEEPPSTESGKPQEEPPSTDSGKLPEEPPSIESGKLPGDLLSAESGKPSEEPPSTESGKLPEEPSSESEKLPEESPTSDSGRPENKEPPTSESGRPEEKEPLSSESGKSKDKEPPSSEPEKPQEEPPFAESFKPKDEEPPFTESENPKDKQPPSVESDKSKDEETPSGKPSQEPAAAESGTLTGIPSPGTLAGEPSQIPEKESQYTEESENKQIETDKTEDSKSDHVHIHNVNSPSKSSQEDDIAHSINTKSKVPESEQAKNDSIIQGEVNQDKEKIKTIDSYTVIEKDLIQKLKTKIDSTGDAVVSDDEETTRVTQDDNYLEEDVDKEDESEVPQEEEYFIEEDIEPPLLSYDESDVKSLDQVAFENHSTSSSPAEAKTTPPEEEVEVTVDVGHATTIKQEKNILTTWGDTFFAIVSGGEHTREVTDPDGIDSEEDEEDMDPVEESEEDKNMYLLSMDKNSMRQHEHSELPFDEDLFFLEEEELLDETLSVGEVDKSLQGDSKINITANSSGGETFSPKSETDLELLSEEPKIVEIADNVDVKGTSDSIMKTRDASTDELTKSLEDSDLPGVKVNEDIAENQDYHGGATSEDPSTALNENKELDVEDLVDESVEHKNFSNKGIELSEESRLENPKINQDLTEEIESVETDSSDPDNVKPTSDPIALSEDVKSANPVPEKSKSEITEDSAKSGDNNKPVDKNLDELSTEEDDSLLKKDDNVKNTESAENETKKEKSEDNKPVDENNLEKLSTKEDYSLLNKEDGIKNTEPAENETKKEGHEQLETNNHGVEQQLEDTREPDTRVNIPVTENGANLDDQNHPEKPLVVDGEETDEENLDELLEDENAVSARRSRQLLENTQDNNEIDENPTVLDPEANTPVPVIIPEAENELTNMQEEDHSVGGNVEAKKDNIPKTEDNPAATHEETKKDNDSLVQNKTETDIPGRETETQQVAATPAQEDQEKETKEDLGGNNLNEAHDKLVNVEEAEELDDDSTGNYTIEETSYIDSIKALTIMREFLDEQRITQFTNIIGHDNILRLEAMFQDMDSELKLARKDNVRLDYIDKAQDEILEASESNILDFVESVLDTIDTNIEIMATEKEIFDDLLDDIQEISYKLRHKHSTLSDSSLLAPGVEGTEIKEEEKPFTDEVMDTQDGEQNIKEEDPARLDPQVEETLQPPQVEETLQPPQVEETLQPPQVEETLQPPLDLQEVEPEQVTPTQETLDSTTPGPGEALAKEEEDHGTVPTDEEGGGGGGSETGESESLQISVSQILSSMGDAVLAAQKSFTPVVGLLMLALPEDLQPGPDFYGVQWSAVITTFLVGLLSVVIFFWRTCLSVKSKVYQVNEKQLADKIAALMKEKSEALEKISEFEKKIKEAKECENTTQEKSTHLQEEAAGLKLTIKELKNSNKQLDAKMRNILQELESQKEHNKRKQEMIYEGQKSIEQLKEHFVQHSAELSELQITLNEVKMKEHKVRSDLRVVQEENARLKERKEQLLQEADGWSERQRELDERIHLQQKSNKDLEEALAYKENEIEVLTNCIMQLKQLEEDSGAGEDGSWPLTGSGELENGELPDKRKEKMKVQIKQMMDVSRVKTTLSIIEEEKDLYQRKLTDEISARHELEEQIKRLEHDNSFLHSDKTCLDNECKTLRQKLEIVTELYQQKEMALQKKLTQEEYERQEKEQKLSAADEKAVVASEEVKIYKQRIQEMDEELQKTERSFKNQIASHEKKAHENWLIARTAERSLAEEKRECANLRQKLIEVNQRIAALQRPSIVKPTPGRPESQPPSRRGAVSRDGSFGPSPVSGGAPSPPMMMDVSARSASANLSRSEDLKGGMEVSSGSRRLPHELSGRTSAPVDLGHSAAIVNSGPRTSSPSVVDGLPIPPSESEATGKPASSPQSEEPAPVMPIAKGPPSFPGTPVMNSPAAAPMMSQPPARFIGPAPPRGSFGSRSLPPTQMHGPPPIVRDFPPRPMMPPAGHMRGPLPPREFPPGPGPRDYPILPPPGARDFPPGLPPPAPRDFPPGLPLGARDFFPGPPHPGAREFPPGLPPRDFPPGGMPPGMRDFPPGPLPPGARDIPPGLPLPGSREFLPGPPPPGARDYPPGLPPGSREFMPRLLPPGARDFPPGPPLAGVRDYPRGPHPGVPAGPSLPEQRAFPPGHNQPMQIDHEQSQGQKS